MLHGRRSGFTLVGVVLVLLVVAVCVLGYFTWSLSAKVAEVDAKGKALSMWAANTDDPANANLVTGGAGLTTWLIHLKNYVIDHAGRKVTGPDAAHTGVHDTHLDPPPPPPW